MMMMLGVNWAKMILGTNTSSSICMNIIIDLFIERHFFAYVNYKELLMQEVYYTGRYFNTCATIMVRTFPETGFFFI